MVLLLKVGNNYVPNYDRADKDLDAESLASWIICLNENDVINSWSMCGMGISDDNMAILISAFVKYKNISFLDLSDNNLTDACAPFIADVISSRLHQLTHLNLCNNNFSSEGISLISRAFFPRSNLDECSSPVSIIPNYRSDITRPTLSELKSKLFTLDVSDNQENIGDEVCMSLAEYIKTSTCRHISLNLRNLGISSSGAVALSSVIPQLSGLDISDNPLAEVCFFDALSMRVMKQTVAVDPGYSPIVSTPSGHPHATTPSLPLTPRSRVLVQASSGQKLLTSTLSLPLAEFLSLGHLFHGQVDVYSVADASASSPLTILDKAPTGDQLEAEGENRMLALRKGLESLGISCSSSGGWEEEHSDCGLVGGNLDDLGVLDDELASNTADAEGDVVDKLHEDPSSSTCQQIKNVWKEKKEDISTHVPETSWPMSGLVEEGDTECQQVGAHHAEPSQSPDSEAGSVNCVWTKLDKNSSTNSSESSDESGEENTFTNFPSNPHFLHHYPHLLGEAEEDGEEDEDEGDTVAPLPPSRLMGQRGQGNFLISPRGVRHNDATDGDGVGGAATATELPRAFRDLLAESGPREIVPSIRDMNIKPLLTPARSSCVASPVNPASPASPFSSARDGPLQAENDPQPLTQLTASSNHADGKRKTLSNFFKALITPRSTQPQPIMNSMTPVATEAPSSNATTDSLMTPKSEKLRALVSLGKSAIKTKVTQVKQTMHKAQEARRGRKEHELEIQNKNEMRQREILETSKNRRKSLLGSEIISESSSIYSSSGAKASETYSSSSSSSRRDSVSSSSSLSSSCSKSDNPSSTSSRSNQDQRNFLSSTFTPAATSVTSLPRVPLVPKLNLALAIPPVNTHPLTNSMQTVSDSAKNKNTITNLISTRRKSTTGGGLTFRQANGPITASDSKAAERVLVASLCMRPILRHLLPTHRFLKNLCLSGTYLETPGLALLIRNFVGAKCTFALESLDISCNRITIVDALSDLLTPNVCPLLADIDLHANPLGNGGVIPLISKLATCLSVTRLDVSNCDLKDAAVTAFGVALQKQSVLRGRVPRRRPVATASPDAVASLHSRLRRRWAFGLISIANSESSGVALGMSRELPKMMALYSKNGLNLSFNSSETIYSDLKSKTTKKIRPMPIFPMLAQYSGVVSIDAACNIGLLSDPPEKEDQWEQWRQEQSERLYGVTWESFPLLPLEFAPQEGLQEVLLDGCVIEARGAGELAQAFEIEGCPVMRVHLTGAEMDDRCCSVLRMSASPQSAWAGVSLVGVRATTVSLDDEDIVLGGGDISEGDDSKSSNESEIRQELINPRDNTIEQNLRLEENEPDQIILTARKGGKPADPMDWFDT